MDLIVTTVAGLEEVAAAEIATFGLRAAPAGPGRLRVPVAAGEVGREVCRLNFGLRCCERVGLLLARAPIDSPEEAEALVAGLDLVEWLGPGRRFAVRGLRRGRHEFTSMDLAGAVGHAVIAGCRARGRPRPPVDLTDPDVVLRAELFERSFLFWLDTTGYEALHVRGWRRYAHMASMRPTMANLLLRLAGWPCDGLLLDPFCGGGTILIEAALWQRGVAPGAVRARPWAWQRIPALAQGGATAGGRGEDDAAAAAAGPGVAPGAAAPVADAPAIPFVGIERFRRHVEGALENIRAAEVGDCVRVHCGLAERADTLVRPAGRRVTVVTNPPFGRRVASVHRVARLYAEAAAAWARLEAERVVTLAERGDLMAEALEAAGFRIERRLHAIYGRTPVQVFVARDR